MGNGLRDGTGPGDRRNGTKCYPGGACELGQYINISGLQFHMGTEIRQRIVMSNVL